MRLGLALCGLGLACGVAAAEPPAAEPSAAGPRAVAPPGAAPPAAEPPAAAPAGQATESVHAALCRLIEAAARQHGVAADFLGNLIWRESSFRKGAVSPAGAQGIAQFMPYTASNRGLADPFDPEQAIPQAARLIADLAARFGNLGLAAAAYNAGPGRVEKWLAKESALPAETRNFVALVTGRSVDDWAAQGAAEPPETGPAARSCGTIVASLRRSGRAAIEAPGAEPMQEATFALWGVQLAGNFSKDRALAAFALQRQRYAGIIGQIRPMIIGTRLRSRGTTTFYRVRVPAGSRQAADTLCNKIRSAGGACIVLRS